MGRRLNLVGDAKATGIASEPKAGCAEGTWLCVYVMQREGWLQEQAMAAFVSERLSAFRELPGVFQMTEYPEEQILDGAIGNGRNRITSASQATKTPPNHRIGGVFDGGRGKD